MRRPAAPGASPGVRPVPRPRPAADERPKAVRRPAGRQRAPFVLLVVGLLCGGLVSLLLLNTVLAQDSFTAGQLRKETEKLQLDNDRLARQNAEAEDPNNLSKLADPNLRPDSQLNVYTNGRLTGESETQVGQDR